MSYIPLINNISPVPQYEGFDVKLGGNSEHAGNRPLISKIGTKKILIVGIGASTPGQVLQAFEVKAKTLKNHQFVNCCVGGQDINDCLNPDGPLWANVDSKLKALNRKHSDVQMVIMCHDDLRDQSTDFSATIPLKDKMISLIRMMKADIFPNLKHVELFSRFYGGRVTDPKFQSPTDYHNGFSNRFVVEECIENGGRIDGVFVNDMCGYLYTDGETLRSDDFQISFSWFKKNGANIHLDTSKNGDEASAEYILGHMKGLYPEFR